MRPQIAVPSQSSLFGRSGGRVCISNKLVGDVDTPGPWTTLENHSFRLLITVSTDTVSPAKKRVPSGRSRLFLFLFLFFTSAFPAPSKVVLAGSRPSINVYLSE